MVGTFAIVCLAEQYCFPSSRYWYVGHPGHFIHWWLHHDTHNIMLRALSPTVDLSGCSLLCLRSTWGKLRNGNMAIDSLPRRDLRSWSPDCFLCYFQSTKWVVRAEARTCIRHSVECVWARWDFSAICTADFTREVRMCDNATVVRFHHCRPLVRVVMWCILLTDDAVDCIRRTTNLSPSQSTQGPTWVHIATLKDELCCL